MSYLCTWRVIGAARYYTCLFACVGPTALHTQYSPLHADYSPFTLWYRARMLCEQLSIMDKIREAYWRWRGARCVAAAAPVVAEVADVS